jgi:hypothetical protein
VQRVLPGRRELESAPARAGDEVERLEAGEELSDRGADGVNAHWIAGGLPALLEDCRVDRAGEAVAVDRLAGEHERGGDLADCGVELSPASTAVAHASSNSAGSASSARARAVATSGAPEQARIPEQIVEGRQPSRVVLRVRRTEPRVPPARPQLDDLADQRAVERAGLGQRDGRRRGR